MVGLNFRLTTLGWWGILKRRFSGDAVIRLRLLARLIGVAGLALLPVYSGAQSLATSDQTQERLGTGGLISSLLAAPVVGQPYSAVQVHSTTQTLADGSTVSHRGHHLVARDAEGRVHVEVRLANGRNGGPDEVMVFVRDPVAHTLTTWVSGAEGRPKTASVFKMPAVQEQGAARVPLRSENPSKDSRPQPIVTVADLGTQSIQGLEVSERRTTTIVPPGRSGNSAPITKTYEVWTSPDLQLVVKQQWSDPRSGERTVELENISRADPDPALFRAPPGYQVKDAVQSLKELEEKLSATQN
jgi:hypothetical protein